MSDLLQAIQANLLSPAVLFFLLGVFATLSKSDLKFPEPLYLGLTIYLLTAIGFKGGVAISNADGTGITDDATLKVSIEAATNVMTEIMQGLTSVDLRAAYANALIAHPAGILGGVIAGVISDHVFQSRRGPMASILYGVMLAGAIAMSLTLENGLVMSLIATVMMLSIIGVHGMLSGTASMDFGGKKNTGVAVGLIDGFVYLGVALEAFVLGRVLPEGDAKHNPANWWTWPTAILPAAIIGFMLCTRVWNAKPTAKAAPAH